jgi:hypothetical protein
VRVCCTREREMDRERVFLVFSKSRVMEMDANVRSVCAQNLM